MSVTAQPAGDGIRHKLRRLGWRNPEWWVVISAAVAWLFMAGVSPTHANGAGITPSGYLGQGIIGTVAMVIAMMVPLTITNVRHVAQSSLWRRRHRAIAGFLVGFLAVWLVVQTIIVGTWGLFAPVVGWGTAAGVAAVAAALWEIAPLKRRRLRRCHRTVPLAPRGWRAHADCARYGVSTGLGCVTMCWALMVAAAAFSHSLVVMIVLFGVQVSGRYQRRPSPVLAALVVIGTCLLAFAADSFMSAAEHSHSMH